MSRAAMRLLGFLKKEQLQILRDPSSIALALVMPVVLILLFGYGVSLDAEDVPVAVVLDDPGTSARELLARLEGSRYFAPAPMRSLAEAERAMADHAVEAIVHVDSGFEHRLATGEAPAQLLLRGIDSNRARLISGYFDGIVGLWSAQRRLRGEPATTPPVVVEPRVWFNEDSRSTNFLVPGLVALVMTLTGVLLTALVVAREWERGTMEAILATPLRASEFLFAKILPYYVLGMGGMLLAVGLGVALFDVPMRGSFAALFGVSSLFLLASLGLGLAISSAVRAQFVAAQISIIAGFLPTFFLSGLLFDLESVPRPIQWISHIVPARWFVSAAHTLFLAGDVWPVLWPDVLTLAGMAVVLIGLARRKTPEEARRLMALWFRQLVAIAVKELLTILADPRSRFVVIGPPIIQFFIFGYAATFDVHDVAYAVVDEDRTPASRDLLQRFAATPAFHCVAELEDVQSIDATLDLMKARLVLHVGAGFSERLASGRPAPLQLLLDGRNSNVAGIASGYVQSIVAAWNRERLAADRGARVDLVERAWFNPELDSRWFIVSALPGQLALVVVLLLTSLSVAREREQGSFDQTLVAPVDSAQILIGKALPAFLFGLLDGLLLSAAAVVWFGIPMTGTLAALVAVVSVYIVAVSGIGLFISSLCATMQQALLGGFLFIMPAVILSGFTTPIENMPGWLRAATLGNPARHVVAGCRAVFLEGADVAAVSRYLWPMALVAAVCLTAAGVLFRKRTR